MNTINPYPIKQLMKSCNLCNRHCHVDRNETVGYCGQTAKLRAARAALHFWEEPCISGKNGSGPVFFSGCSLHCIFCQNYGIAMDSAISEKSAAPRCPITTKKSAGSITGKTISVERLSEIFLELQEKGAHNINLVTPSHFIPQIVSALTLSKSRGLSLPIVYNTGSYETVDALKMLDGLVDIYLPDLKYHSPRLSTRYSHAPDYFSCASEAIQEMFRQVGRPQFDSNICAELPELSENSLMKRGMIVRHLLLPGCLKDSKNILSYLYHTYGDSVFVSIMSQYTPMPQLATGTSGMASPLFFERYPELTRRVTKKEYDELTDFALSLGMENVFIQDMDVAQDSFIPAFDLEGI